MVVSPSMSSWFLAAPLLLALFGAVAVVAFESPTRSAGGLITAFLGVAAAAGALGAPVVPGFLLWVGAGGIGLLLLCAVLLLNPRDDEHGPRRFQARAMVVVPLLGALWFALTNGLLEALPPAASGASVPSVHIEAPLSADAVSNAVSGPLAVPFTVALVALAAALMVAVALVRRRT